MTKNLFYIDNSSLNTDPLKVLPTCTHTITENFILKRVSTTQKRLSSVISPSSKLYSVLETRDILPGVYEGGFTCWECSRSLCEYLSKLGRFFLLLTIIHIILNFCIDFKGKSVIELGCGHGLPGITTLAKGASHVFFLDFNEEVIKFFFSFIFENN